MAKKYRPRGRPQVKKPKAPHSASRNPQIPLDKLRKEVFWFSRNDGESKDIIYISTIHDVIIGRPGWQGDLRVHGKIICDGFEDTKEKPTLAGITWGLTKDTTSFSYDRQTGVPASAYAAGEFNVFVIDPTTTYKYEDSSSPNYKKAGTYYISLSSMASLSAAISTVGNQAHVTPSNWTGAETAVNSLNVTIYAYATDNSPMSATFTHTYTVSPEASGGLNALVNPSAVTLSADSSGNVSDFSATACAITVTEGGSPMTAVAAGSSLTANGSFKVSSVSSPQTTGNETVNSNSLSYAAISSMSSDTIQITWNLDVKMSDGSTTTAAVTQTISKAIKGGVGQSALMVSVTPNAVTLSAGPTGAPSSFAPTACSITVTEGGTALTAVASAGSLTNGSFKVTNVSQGTTDQSISNETVNSNSLSYAAISSMSSDQTIITWTLSIKMSDGTSITGNTVVQSIAIARDGQVGQNALSMEVNPPAVTLNAGPTGAPSSFAPTACVIKVFEAGTELTAVANSGTLTNGSFKVTSISQGTTDQSTANESIAGTECSYAAISSMSSDQTSITWTLSIKMSDGTSVTGAGVTQTISIARNGAVGKDGLYIKWGPESVTVQADSSGNVSVSALAPTAASFSVYQGATRLTVDSSLGNNSTFFVGTSPTSPSSILTPGTVTNTLGANSATCSQATAFEAAQNVGEINFTLSVKDSAGVTQSFTLTQIVTKALQGTGGSVTTYRTTTYTLTVAGKQFPGVGSANGKAVWGPVNQTAPSNGYWSPVNEFAYKYDDSVSAYDSDVNLSGTGSSAGQENELFGWWVPDTNKNIVSITGTFTIDSDYATASDTGQKINFIIYKADASNTPSAYVSTLPITFLPDPNGYVDSGGDYVLSYAGTYQIGMTGNQSVSSGASYAIGIFIHDSDSTRAMSQGRLELTLEIGYTSS